MHHKYLGGQHKVDPFFYIHGIPMVHYMVYPMVYYMVYPMVYSWYTLWYTTWYTMVYLCGQLLVDFWLTFVKNFC